MFVVKLSDTQNSSNLVTNDDLAWSLNGASLLEHFSDLYAFFGK